MARDIRLSARITPQDDQTLEYFRQRWNCSRTEVLRRLLAALRTSGIFDLSPVKEKDHE